MITLNASGGSVTFTFSGNSTYLNDGTITVPVNSLALIIDESDMVTFRKSASADIFVSANIAEFGMTKAELESWYKANMVGSTGGDITSGEVQTMIDESISGKADSSAVTEEISAAVSGKMDTSAYTVDASVNSASTNPVQNQALYGELRTTGKGYVPLTWDGHYTTNFESGATSIKIVANNGGFEQYGLVGTNTSYSTDYVQVGYDVDGNYWYCNSLVGGHITTAATDNVMIISWPSSLGVTQIYNYQWGTPNWIEYGIGDVIVPLKDNVVSKNTYEAYTADTTPKVDEAWQQGVKNPSLGYDVTSGITLEYSVLSGGNLSYTSLPTDDSIWYSKTGNGVNVLGVYATGATRTVNVNPSETNQRAYLSSIPLNIKMYWNASYTGNTTHYIAVSCLVNDGTNGYCQWNWDGSQYNANDKYINTAVTLSYDSTNQVVTITPSSSSALTNVVYVRCNRNIAPSSALTQEDCRIGAVTIDTNSYKLQEALDNKQDILSAGTGISISGNVISATGGGSKAIKGGIGISVTTGATADTVSLNVPISGGSEPYSIQENGGTALGDYSHAEGINTMTMASSMASHAEGESTVAGGVASHTEGVHTTANNLAEHASGRYNKSSISSNTFGDSGNTLFTVGNGTSSADTHNAFEIRQNGDIYFEYDGSDVKLQDKLDEIETVTAAALNNLNDRFGGLSLVKLTQTEYDNLQTKDPNVLYVIVG